MIFETGLSTLNISRAKRAPNTINFVDMRLVLVFLATFRQSLFNLFNVQNLIYWFVCIVQHSPTANVDSCHFKPMSTDAEKTKSPI